MRDGDVTRRGIDECRRVLDAHGLLLVQDARLPSVTSALVIALKGIISI